MFNNLLIKYMCVGAFATLIDMGLFWLLIYYGGFHYSYALCMSFSVGIFVNFICCDLFIFKREQPFWRACLKHYGASTTGFVINQCGLLIAVFLFKCHRLTTVRLIMAALTFLLNFFLIKKFAFGEKH